MADILAKGAADNKDERDKYLQAIEEATGVSKWQVEMLPNEAALLEQCQAAGGDMEPQWLHSYVWGTLLMKVASEVSSRVCRDPITKDAFNSSVATRTIAFAIDNDLESDVCDLKFIGGKLVVSSCGAQFGLLGNFYSGCELCDVLLSSPEVGMAKDIADNKGELDENLRVIEEATGVSGWQVEMLPNEAALLEQCIAAGADQVTANTLHGLVWKRFLGEVASEVRSEVCRDSTLKEAFVSAIPTRTIAFAVDKTAPVRPRSILPKFVDGKLVFSCRGEYFAYNGHFYEEKLRDLLVKGDSDDKAELDENLQHKEPAASATSTTTNNLERPKMVQGTRKCRTCIKHPGLDVCHICRGKLTIQNGKKPCSSCIGTPSQRKIPGASVFKKKCPKCNGTCMETFEMMQSN